jgi:hypothetical protein
VGMHYLWMVLTVLTGLLGQQDKPKECLIYYGITDVYTLSLPDGTITSTPFPDNSLPASVYIAPDGTRKIVENTEYQFIYSANQIEVERLKSPIPYASKWRYQHDPFRPDAIWAPNSEMFAFLRTTEDKTYLGISDADGNIVKEVLISNSSGTRIQLDSWSSDSQYIAILLRPTDDIFNPE